MVFAKLGSHRHLLGHLWKLICHSWFQVIQKAHCCLILRMRTLRPCRMHTLLGLWTTTVCASSPRLTCCSRPPRHPLPDTPPAWTWWSSANLHPSHLHTSPVLTHTLTALSRWGFVIIKLLQHIQIRFFFCYVKKKLGEELAHCLCLSLHIKSDMTKWQKKAIKYLLTICTKTIQRCKMLNFCWMVCKFLHYIMINVEFSKGDEVYPYNLLVFIY